MFVERARRRDARFEPLSVSVRCFEAEIFYTAFK